MKYIAIVMAWAAFALPGQTQELGVNIAKELPNVEVQTEHGPVTIQREQDTEHQVSGEWARTSRPCPPFCIQPMTPVAGVATIAELELLDMLQDPEIIVLDSRTSDWFQNGTIPGAINLPYSVILDQLDVLGCEADFDGWDCSNASKVALFCNGPWCGQSPTAIRHMVSAGYPVERIFYYRGGMQAWQVLGLNTVLPGGWE